MRKKFLVFVMVSIMLVGVVGCGKEEKSEVVSNETTNETASEIPEVVTTVQRKIDKALESTPSYSDIKEIEILYNELLKAEQELIQNYDRIQEMFSLTQEDAVGIFAVQMCVDRLKNPSSLELISVGTNQDVLDTYHVCIQYSAENDFGGRIEDVYYVSVDIPTYDETTGIWSCKLQDLFASRYKLELLNAALGSNNAPDSQKYAQKDYEYNLDKVTELDTQKIMDNLDNVKTISEYIVFILQYERCDRV